MITVLKFDGGYGRTGIVGMGYAECDRCKEATLCLTMDGSDGEYGQAYLCHRCIESWFSNWLEIQAEDEAAEVEATPLGYEQGWQDAKAGHTDTNQFNTRWSEPPAGMPDNWTEYWRQGQEKGARDYISKHLTKQ